MAKFGKSCIMMMSPQSFFSLLVQSLRHPREGANTLLSIGFPREALWPFAMLVVVVGSLISGFGQLASPTQIEGMTIPTPWIITLMQFGLLTVTIFVVYWMGQALDGEGSFNETVLLIAWLQAMSIAGQLGVLVIGSLLPSLAVMLFLAFGVYMIFATITFIDVLHRLNSMGKAAMMFALSVGATLLGLTVILSLIRVGSPNV
jgi:hypothetical protein